MTDRAAARGPLVEIVAAAVAGGVDWVQVRERQLEGADLLEHAVAIARAAREAARRRGAAVRVLVNRRIDVALCADLDGAHLGYDALAPAAARALLGPAALLGLSTHAPEEARRAAEEPLDYLQLAPIFPPRSKEATRPALGLPALERACQQPLPVFAQGGIGAANARDCIAAGAAGVAVSGEILASADPCAAARAIADRLHG